MFHVKNFSTISEKTGQKQAACLAARQEAYIFRPRSGDRESGSRVSEVDCCSGHENGGAFKPAGAEIGEGLVGLAQLVARGLGDDADLRGEMQEI